jgi:hypothetical protein
MAIADHISPREAVRFALKDRFRDLIEGAVQRIDVDAPLFPEAPGELGPDGEPAKLWQNVPVITVADFEAAFATTFGERLPAPSERTAEAATPALVIISAVCPRCQMPARIPLAVDVELHQDRDGETLHLKAKSKEAIHVCGQMPLPEGEEPAQGSFGLDDIVGPVPSADELAVLLAAVLEEIPLDHQPNLERTAFAATVEAWDDLTRREVALWAHTKRQELDGVVDEPINLLPFVLGGEPPFDVHEVTQEDMDAEADLGSEEETDEEASEDGLCPYPGCVKAIDHKGKHTPPADDDLLPV